jgi:hypothetical protein
VLRGATEHIDGMLENERSYFYQISALDAAGNEGPISSSVLGMPRDVVPPALPVMDPLPELTRTQEHTVSGSAEANASVVVVLDREEVLTIPVGPDGRFSATLTLPQGVNRLRFKARDSSNNPSGLTPEVIVQVDITPPRVASTQPLDGQKRVGISETILVVLTEAILDSTVEAKLVFNGTDIEVDSSFEYSSVARTITIYPSTRLEKGMDYRVEVQGSDAAGNVLEGASFSFQTVPEPVQEPVISTSSALVLALLLALGIAVGLVLRRGRREAPDAVQATPAPSHQPEEASYDPSPHRDEPRHSDDGWEEY